MHSSLTKVLATTTRSLPPSVQDQDHDLHNAAPEIHSPADSHETPFTP